MAPRDSPAKLEASIAMEASQLNISTVRHRALQSGYRVVKSRQRPHRHNRGLYKLVHRASGEVVIGENYDAELERIVQFLNGNDDQSLSLQGELVGAAL